VIAASVGDNCVDRYVDLGLDLAGGNALNVAAGLAAAGVESHYLGAVGEDAEGELVLDGARAAGVDVSRVERIPLPTGVTLVRLGADGDRAFLEERYGASAAYQPGDADVAFLRTCSWVHCANLAGTAVLVEQLDGVRASFDFTDDPDPESLDRLAPHLALAFFSGASLGRDDAEALARRAIQAGAEEAIVTRGRAGSVGVNSRVASTAAHPVDVVDTLGAGDALIAGVIAARLQGLDLEDALEAGSAAAARACTHHGAWEQT
jgi:fructoselysine 6-kinase